MPTTNRGYPYETGADQPGHSLTGGSAGNAPILAQVVDADVQAIDNRLTTGEGDIGALEGRMTTAESGITSLDSRVTATENDVTALDGRVTTAEGDIVSLDGRVTVNEGNIATVTGDLAAHEAATTTVHGITDTANLVYTDDARLSDAREPEPHAATHATGGTDPLAAADIDAYPVTGGEIEGDASMVAHNFTWETLDGLNALRARSTGAAVDFDTVGDTTVISWSGVDFTGTETIRQRWHAGGMTVSGRLAVGTTVYDNDQYIDADAGVALLGGKNDAEPVTLCGRLTTSGAPAVGTWDAGDLVIDVDGVWHLCTAGGTPGTWT